MANISSSVKSALATLNEVKLMTSGGQYGGPLLGDLISQAMSANPLTVWTGTDDPSIAPGVVDSKPGDLYLRDAPGAGGGQLWVNVGDLATSWLLINTGGAIYNCRSVISSASPEDDRNVEGLASAILLANNLKTTMEAHAADILDHTTAIDDVNFPLVAPAATDLAELITLVTEMLTAYDAHDDDAELGAAWVFHAGQETGDHSLASVVAPTTLAECITRLNDILVKYNAHDVDAVAHGVGSAHQESTAAAAVGDSVTIPEGEALPGDEVQWAIIDGGAIPKVGVSAQADTGVIIFTFSATPTSDMIISYSLFRAA